MPMFHREHCVFCAFLSDGTDYTNCGRPCERYQVTLRDRIGTEHILQTDTGCQKLLQGAISGTQPWRALKLHRQLGVTRGTLR